MVKERVWIAGLLIAAALAAVALTNMRDAKSAPQVPGTEPPEQDEERPPASPASTAPLANTAPSASTAPGTPSTADNPVARMLQLTDEADRTLLSELERQSATVPPQTVHDLLALRRTGAHRPELERFITAHLGTPLTVRIAAMRWLNAVSASGGAAAQPASPVPSSFGKGGGPQRMQPIAPAR